MQTIGGARTRARAARRVAALVLLSASTAACPGLPTGNDPRVEDPCYSPTVWVDTLSMQVDSVSWDWTPGLCD